MKKANWIKNAYKTTSVYWAKSQSDIMKMLGQIGVDQIRFTSLPDRMVLEFVMQEENRIPMGVRIVTPLRSKTDSEEKRNKELNTVHRILLNHLKAKFLAVGAGLTEFEQEFMAHLIVKGKDGKDTTIGEQLLPQYHKHIEGKEGPLLLN